MSGTIEGMIVSVHAMDEVVEECARDVADLFQGRMQTWRAEVSGEQISMRSGFLSDGWSEDMAEQIDKTMARVAGAK